MQSRDGFIISVFHYCDRWCETCALTSQCRMFANVTREAASEGVPLPHDLPAPPKWIEDVFEEMHSLAGGSLMNGELAAWAPKIAAAHREIYDRAKAYCAWAHDALRGREPRFRHDSRDPIAVISWFSFFNASTIRRALIGLAEFDGYREVPPDHEGAAKVALLGIDRSHAAWQQLVAERRISAADARPFLDELEWIRTRLEAAVPGARAFVRPGFDEPGAVATLPSTPSRPSAPSK